MAESQPPTPEVVAAFGASETPVRLPGGRGLTWRSGHVVLRPAEGQEETEWKSHVLSVLPDSTEFVIPRPLRDDRGHWMRDGWEALEWIGGAADPRRVADVVRAGAAFHRAIADLPEPSFIAATDHAWSRADRIAWSESRLPDDALLESLAAEYRVVCAPNQVIHADLLGNVLFSERRPPAVIDWAPYWRPAGFGAAVAVADAVCWHGHPLEGLHEDYGIPQWRQLLLRALVFRVATLHGLGLWDDAIRERHVPVARAIIALQE